ncbi:MAG: hypothetical protein ACLSHO_02830 [Dysosmobacter sp.]
MLPAKSLLFHRAFIYIHFPVLYEPSTPAEEKNPAELPPQRCSKPLFIAFFNFSHKRPTLAFTAESGYTLAFANRIAHSGLHGETEGVLDGGAITTLGAFHTFPETLRGRGLKRQTLPLLGLGRGDAPEERRKPSEQRCAYARRCSEGVAHPAGLRDLLQFGDVAVFSLCAQYFLNVRGRGYYYPRRALRAAETPDGRLSKWFICRFPGSLSTIPCAVTFSANMQISLSVISVANAFALWYDKSHKSGLFGDDGEPE